MYDFAYQKPSSLADAVKALSADPDAKALAGGMTLIPVLKQRLNEPSVVVDLAKLGLVGISVAGNTVTISGMTTHGDVAGNAAAKAKIPSLVELASHIGDEAVRHRGTIGGSLANNDPAADYPAAALALGATIKTDRRSITADDFFQGMFTTALEQGELITSVEFPAPEKGAYEKFRNPASRYAIVGVYVAKTAGGVRVAVTGAGQNGVFRHTAMEQALSANFSPAAIANIVTPADGMNSDIHASAEYRAHLVGVMAKRAVARGVLSRRMRGIGDNGGPPLDPEIDPNESWRHWCWKRTVKRAWKTPGREIALCRLARAEALGISYRDYTLEIMERGVYL